jgi:hypothetical protein
MAIMLAGERLCSKHGLKPNDLIKRGNERMTALKW